MILADSSAWIEYDRATGSRVDRRLTELIETGGRLATTEPVVLEVLMGARTDDREAQLRRLLDRFELIPFRSPSDFDAALRIYRHCLAVGVSPRGIVDCMITAVAARAGAAVLAQDIDFARTAEVAAVTMDGASLTSGKHDP